jgi:O-antigen/teichoic acid export membrane protein
LLGGYLTKNYHLSLNRIDVSFWKQQLKYSIPIGMANVAWLIQIKLHVLAVAYLFPPATLAIYMIGTYSAPFVSLIGTSVANVMVPALSLAQKQGDKQRILDVWGGSMRKMNLIFFPLFVFFFIIANEFVIALFTIEYIQSVTIFQVFLIGFLFSGMNTSAVLNAYAKTRYQMKIALYRLPIALATLYLFIELWGVLGAAIAGVSITLGFRIFELKKVAQVLKVPFWSLLKPKENFRIFAIAMFAGVPVYIIKIYLQTPPILTLITAFPVYFISFIILSIWLKITSLKEISLILSAIKHKKASTS